MRVYVVVYRDGGLISGVEGYDRRSDADAAAEADEDEDEGYGRYADVFEVDIIRKKGR